MALGHNTTIVRSGLVFYYDMSNTQKSWRGEPTTNLYDFGYYQAEGGHTATRTVGDAPGLSTSVVDYHTISTSGSWITESARLIIWPATTLAASTTFRVSFWARVTSKGTTTIKSAFYGNSVNNSHSLTTSWQRFSYSSTTHPAYRALEFGSDDGAITFQIAGIQWESKSIQTPYVKTSRSNTQAILDLTNTSTITADNLTYNADGTFSFDGTNNYCTTNNIFAGMNNNPTGWTISAWIKLSATVGITGAGDPLSGACIIGNDDALGIGLQIVNGNKVNYGLRSYGNFDSVATLSNNVWYNVAGVLAIGGGGSIYVNGAFDSSNVYPTNSIASSAVMKIGWCPNRVTTKFPGQISNVSMYNRALTANEIAQNFAALRDRYGI